MMDLVGGAAATMMASNRQRSTDKSEEEGNCIGNELFHELGEKAVEKRCHKERTREHGENRHRCG